ncbi:MAE_28990/MAE_18760 family HEPN-like nuclease [Rhizobium ruizarguesonis]|uniref:MAE_28990/MAE_18760 family HEPN-like nuclease n=1 Tax=Rhizobium ruizarguesonis TaxID=2081791 RepID=UPI0010325F2A|nr:MAE_28990/MAE_18760 family HEPN-like nuclease [Rhizobium ruizarguesonis]NEI26818.1 hypothetical protein [Rhizobium ruizarguesonis]TBB95498.1 hypothetical protein ELH38_26740 [Rhizobium ruizarguesonis]
MIPFQSEFAERRQQVKRYISIVLSEQRAQVSGVSSSVLIQRQNVLKAGSFLILYNLIEATARSAIDAIHDDMIATKVTFEELRPPLRSEVIRGFKRRSNPEAHRDLTDIPVSLVAASLDTEHSFSGNVDARMLRDLGDVYGFSTVSDKERTRNGADLLTIKTNRNDLAHGRKTYEEVGRAYTSREILSLALRATFFIDALVLNVASYVGQREYLKPPPEGG